MPAAPLGQEFGGGEQFPELYNQNLIRIRVRFPCTVGTKKGAKKDNRRLNLSTIQNGIEKRLWAMADELRANSRLRASEYSMPVLGLIFLRYAEYRFTRAEEEISGTVSTSRRRSSGTDQREEYQARGVFYLPKEARFQHLLNLPESENIAQAITDAMKAIERENRQIDGVLPKTYNRLEKSTLIELLRTMAQIPMDIEGDAFGKIYEYFLGNFAMVEGQRGGEFFTPTSLVKLIVEILQPFQGRILDPACGSGGMFVQSADFIQNHRENGDGQISILRHRAGRRDHPALQDEPRRAWTRRRHQASQQLLRRPASVPRQVRLRDGKSALQRGSSGQRTH